MTDTRADAPASYFSALMAEHHTKVLSERTRDFFSDTERLGLIARQRQNMAAEQAQGWIFEQLEVARFNLDALRNNSSLKASTTDVLGQVNDPVADIVIRNRDNTEHLKAYQAKSSGKPVETIKQMSPEKYAKVNLVGPADQHERINELMDKRIETGGINTERYKSMKERLDKGIEHEGIGSGGTTYEEAVRNTDVVQADQTAQTLDRQAIGNEMHQAGMQAGVVGGAIGGGFTLAAGLWQMHKGTASGSRVALDTVYSTAGSFATSYATAAASKGIPHLLSNIGVSKTVVGALNRSNAHVAIASGVVQSARHLTMYLKGDIEFDAMINEVSGTAILTSSTFYYGALGQVLIPVPVVGAMVGSTLGYFIGSMLHQSGVISLGETAEARIARERRERIEELCYESIARMQASRLAMTELLDAHFADQAATLAGAFDEMDMAMTDWNADSYVQGLSKLNATFGHSLKFENFDSFDAFMVDDQAVFVL